MVVARKSNPQINQRYLPITEAPTIELAAAGETVAIRLFYYEPPLPGSTNRCRAATGACCGILRGHERAAAGGRRATRRGTGAALVVLLLSLRPHQLLHLARRARGAGGGQRRGQHPPAV